MPDIERAMPQDNAGMVKLVYTTDSKSVAFGRGGSSPPTGTIFKKKDVYGRPFLLYIPRHSVNMPSMDVYPHLVKSSLLCNPLCNPK